MPAAPTLSAILQFDTRSRRSTSRPTRNKKSTRPTLAASESVGMEALGNMASEKPGMRPKTDGPRRIPPTISAMTRGWRILERGKCRRRVKMMMMPACEYRQKSRSLAFLSTCLDNEDDDGVLGVIFAGVFAFNDTALTCCSLICYTRGGSLCCYRRSDC